MGVSSREPMTIDDLARPPEAERGREILFCPILSLPLVPALRVRTLPGFHLLSLDAGKEALAMGFYTAFGERFVCQNLEYLHPEDKVFICAEDNKAFLNEMSMRYHKYIGHELKDRKAERKRLRERAEELKIRRANQAAQRQLAPSAQDALPADVASGAGGVLGAIAAEDPYGGAVAAAAPVVTSPPSAAADDPYGGQADPLSALPVAAKALAPAGKSPEAANPVRRSALRQPAATVAMAPIVAATTQAEQAATSLSRSPFVPAPAVPAPAPVIPAVVAVDAGGGEDLYGDLGERDSKRQRPNSAYASAIGSMLEDDFDDDD